MKKKSDTPRRKRMNKQARLKAALPWMKSYNGKNMIAGYAKWFGVDKLCAMRELKILGFAISETLEKQITDSVNHRIAQKSNELSSLMEYGSYEDYF